MAKCCLGFIINLNNPIELWTVGLVCKQSFSVEDGFHKIGTHTVLAGTAWNNSEVAGLSQIELQEKRTL